MTFVLKDGTEKAVEGKAGQSVLSVAHEHDVDLEGACESSLACSTCHVVVDDEFYERLKEPCEEEEDMLDLAWGLTPTYVHARCASRPACSHQPVTAALLPVECHRADHHACSAGGTHRSRLGCQVILSPELDGLRVTLPKATRNMYVDGHVPKPH